MPKLADQLHEEIGDPQAQSQAFLLVVSCHQLAAGVGNGTEAVVYRVVQRLHAFGEVSTASIRKERLHIYLQRDNGRMGKQLLQLPG